MAYTPARKEGMMDDELIARKIRKERKKHCCLTGRRGRGKPEDPENTGRG